MALTVDPPTRLKGGYYKVAIGTVQVVAAGVQLVIFSKSPTYLLMKTEYNMIGAPPSEVGAVQVTTTSVPEIAVVGVPGTEGGDGKLNPPP